MLDSQVSSHQQDFFSHRRNHHHSTITSDLHHTSDQSYYHQNEIIWESDEIKSDYHCKLLSLISQSTCSAQSVNSTTSISKRMDYLREKLLKTKLLKNQLAIREKVLEPEAKGEHSHGIAAM